MASILLTAPAVEPLVLADAKLYLRVEHDDDDALITALIAAARMHIEMATRRALIAQEWRFILHAWPADGRVILLRAPVREVIAARVYDADNVAHALDIENFVVDPAAAPGVIAFPPWAVAAPGRLLAGIEIDASLGYGDSADDVPAPLVQAIRMLIAHWYEHRAVAAETAHALLPAAVEALIAPYRVLTL